MPLSSDAFNSSTLSFINSTLKKHAIIKDYGALKNAGSFKVYRQQMFLSSHMKTF